MPGGVAGQCSVESWRWTSASRQDPAYDRDHCKKQQIKCEGCEQTEKHARTHCTGRRTYDLQVCSCFRRSPRWDQELGAWLLRHSSGLLPRPSLWQRGRVTVKSNRFETLRMQEENKKKKDTLTHRQPGHRQPSSQSLLASFGRSLRWDQEVGCCTAPVVPVVDGPCRATLRSFS